MLIYLLAKSADDVGPAALTLLLLLFALWIMNSSESGSRRR